MGKPERFADQIPGDRISAGQVTEMAIAILRATRDGDDLASATGSKPSAFRRTACSLRAG
jgi:hypothetical protein